MEVAIWTAVHIACRAIRTEVRIDSIRLLSYTDFSFQFVYAYSIQFQ